MTFLDTKTPPVGEDELHLGASTDGNVHIAKGPAVGISKEQETVLPPREKWVTGPHCGFLCQGVSAILNHTYILLWYGLCKIEHGCSILPQGWWV